MALKSGQNPNFQVSYYELFRQIRTSPWKYWILLFVFLDFCEQTGKKLPILGFRPGMGSVFLSAAQDDVEKDEDGQLHCQNDPFQIHHS